MTLSLLPPQVEKLVKNGGLDENLIGHSSGNGIAAIHRIQSLEYMCKQAPYAQHFTGSGFPKKMEGEHDKAYCSRILTEYIKPAIVSLVERGDIKAANDLYDASTNAARSNFSMKISQEEADAIVSRSKEKKMPLGDAVCDLVRGHRVVEAGTLISRSINERLSPQEMLRYAKSLADIGQPDKAVEVIMSKKFPSRVDDCKLGEHTVTTKREALAALLIESAGFESKVYYISRELWNMSKFDHLSPSDVSELYKNHIEQAAKICHQNGNETSRNMILFLLQPADHEAAKTRLMN